MRDYAAEAAYICGSFGRGCRDPLPSADDALDLTENLRALAEVDGLLVVDLGGGKAHVLDSAARSLMPAGARATAVPMESIELPDGQIECRSTSYQHRWLPIHGAAGARVHWSDVLEGRAVPADAWGREWDGRRWP